MSGFIYYLPGAGGSVQYEDLTQEGIAYAFERRPPDHEPHCTERQVARGPDDAAGVVIADPDSIHESKIGYYPDRQRWRALPGGGAWVGFCRDDPPQPQELIRCDAINGHRVTLADEQEWLIPVARALAEDDGTLVGYCALPERIGLNDAGRWQRDGVIEKHARLWQIAVAWWDAMSAVLLETDSRETPTDDAVSFSFEGKIAAAVTVLGTNYRLGIVETDLLNLLSDESIDRILMALIDWPTAERYLQKKTAHGPPIAG